MWVLTFGCGALRHREPSVLRLCRSEMAPAAELQAHSTKRRDTVVAKGHLGTSADILLLQLPSITTEGLYKQK